MGIFFLSGITELLNVFQSSVNLFYYLVVDSSINYKTSIPESNIKSKEFISILLLLAATYILLNLYKKIKFQHSRCAFWLATLRQSRCDRCLNPTEFIFVLEEIPEYSGQRKVKGGTQGCIMYSLKSRAIRDTWLYLFLRVLGQHPLCNAMGHCSHQQFTKI